MVVVTAPEMRSAEVGGAGDVTLREVDGDALVLRVAGAGDITADGRERRLEATVDGAGDVRIRASDTLDATVGGVGDIEYLGDPKLTQKVDGVGEIRRG